VVETIQQRVAEGLPLVTIWREDPGLAGAASRFWGGRRNAVIAAGFEPPSRVWSRAMVIEELRRVYPRLKQGLTVAHPRLAKAAAQHFGSYRKAVVAAGLEIRSRKWSRERLIHAIQDRYVQGLPLKCLGTNVDIMLVSAAKLHFGRWRAALKAAGVPCPPPRRRWGRERVLAAVRAHYRDDGIPVRIRRPNSRVQSAVQHYFGHWHAALLAAGFSLPPSGKTWTRETLMAELQARRVQGLAVTWDKNRDIAYVARKLFGSWTAALQAANIPVHRIRWTGQSVIREIQNRFQQGLSLSSGIAANYTLAAAAVKHLGSWSQALRAAGISKASFQLPPVQDPSHDSPRGHSPDRSARPAAAIAQRRRRAARRARPV
jgi:hypothetical protein